MKKVKKFKKTKKIRLYDFLILKQIQENNTIQAVFILPTINFATSLPLLSREAKSFNFNRAYYRASREIRLFSFLILKANGFFVMRRVR